MSAAVRGSPVGFCAKEVTSIVLQNLYYKGLSRVEIPLAGQAKARRQFMERQIRRAPCKLGRLIRETLAKTVRDITGRSSVAVGCGAVAAGKCAAGVPLW